MSTDKPITSAMRSHAFDTPKHLDFKNGDPDKKYAWVSKLDARLKVPSTVNINYRLGLGYKITEDNKGDMGGPRTSEESKRIENNEMVLMEIPLKDSEEIRSIGEKRSKQRITGVIQDSKRQGYEGGMTITRDSYEKSLNSGKDADNVFDSD